MNNVLSCDFCDWDDSAQVRRTIWSNNSFYAMLAKHPLTPGHLLIVPKRHVERLQDLTRAELTAIMDRTLQFQSLIIEFVAQGCDIRQNCRPYQGEDGMKMYHLHMNLIPRNPGDEIHAISNPVERSLMNEKQINDGNLHAYRTLYDRMIDRLNMSEDAVAIS